MTEVEAFAYLNQLGEKHQDVAIEKHGREAWSVNIRPLDRTGWGNTLLHAVEDLDDKLKESLRDAVYAKLMS